jgi:hypothetical protein
MIREEIISKTLAISSDHTKALTLKPKETIQRILDQDLKGKVYRNSIIVECKLLREPEYIVPSLDNHIAANVDIQAKLTKFVIPKNMILSKCEYIGHVDVIINGINQGEQVYEFAMTNSEFNNNIKLYIPDLGASGEMIRQLKKMAPGQKNINLLVYDNAVMPDIDQNGHKTNKILYFCKLVDDKDEIYIKPAESIGKLEANKIYKYESGQFAEFKGTPENIIDFLTTAELTELVEQLQRL